MRSKKLVVVITTFDIDALRISVPPLHRFSRDFILMVYNGNPNATVTGRMLRALGWRGATEIVNARENSGELCARLGAIEYINDKQIPAEWIMFVDDDDVLIDATIPNVTQDIFAVVQNTTVLSASITDIFKIKSSWTDGAPCGKTGTNFNITGTMVRAKIMFEFADFMRGLMPDFKRVMDRTKYRLPIAKFMWNALTTFMRVAYPEMSQIYMNKTNYIAIKMGHPAEKYGLLTPFGQGAQSNVMRAFSDLNRVVELSAH